MLQIRRIQATPLKADGHVYVAFMPLPRGGFVRCTALCPLQAAADVLEFVLESMDAARNPSMLDPCPSPSKA